MAVESEINSLQLVSALKAENNFLRSALDAAECGRALLRQREEFSLLLDVGKQIISELDPDKVLQLVAGKAREIVDADLVLVPMLNEERSRYTYVAASGIDSGSVQGVSFNADVGMCGWVLKHERSLLLGEESDFWLDRKEGWEKGMQSAVLVPLFGRNRIIGGLSALGKKGGGSFTRHDMELLTIFANQVSTAIENALLFRRLSEEVGESRRKERLIREREAWFRAIFNASNDAIFIHDAETGEILDVNQRMCDMYGYTKEEALKLDVGALSSGVSPYTLEDALGKINMAAEGMSQLFEWRARDKNGRLFWVEVNMRFALMESGKRLIVAVRDISERKAAEEELSKYRERLELLVKERTAQLEAKIAEVQKLNKLFIGRELRMVELKKRIRELEGKLVEESEE